MTREIFTGTIAAVSHHFILVIQGDRLVFTVESHNFKYPK